MSTVIVCTLAICSVVTLVMGLVWSGLAGVIKSNDQKAHTLRYLSARRSSGCELTFCYGSMTLPNPLRRNDPGPGYGLVRGGVYIVRGF